MRCKHKMHAVDASSVDLWLAVCPRASLRRTKAALKLPVGLDQGVYPPNCVSVNDGQTGDVTAAHTWALPAGSVLSVSPVRRILRRLQLAPRRPQWCAAKDEPADVQRWQAPEFPRPARRSRELGALLACADESGLAAPSVFGRLGGNCGQTPRGRVASGRFRRHQLAASSPEGQL